jgi:thiol:disulfide interchange protein DsbG
MAATVRRGGPADPEFADQDTLDMKLLRKALMALPLASLVTAPLLCLTSPASAAGTYPPVQRPDAPALQYQRSQGVELRPLGHVNGIDSWLAKTRSGEIVVMHLTPDGQALIVSGYVVGRSGDPKFNVTEDQISALVQSMAAQKAEELATASPEQKPAPHPGEAGQDLPDFFKGVLNADRTHPAAPASASAHPAAASPAAAVPALPASPIPPKASSAQAVTAPAAAVALPMPSAEEVAAASAQLADVEQLTSIEIGDPQAPVVHMVADPNCVYCSQAWKHLAPAVDAGKIRLKVALVAVLKQSSIGKNAAILQSPNPAQAFKKNEEGYGQAARGEGGIEAIEPSQVSLIIMRNNYKFMEKHGINITPYFVYSDKAGTPRIAMGAEGELLDGMLNILH